MNLELLERIKTGYDTFYIDTPKGYDFDKVEIYQIDSSKQNLIFKDSLDNVIAIRIKENNKDVFVQEFYPNGQAKGKTEFIPGKIDGPAVYYYQDGRIKSRGQWTNGKRNGEWKWFNEDGYLTSIETLDDKGETINKVELHR